MAARAQLVGNRLALLGAVVYLSEWAVIPFVPDLPTDRLGDNAAGIAPEYDGHATQLAFLAGWLSVVLIGRVVFTAGLRDALRGSPRALGLADVAVGAMILSVAIEVVQLGLIASAGWLAEAQGDSGPTVALDAAGTVLFTLVLAPLGVSVLAGSAAMLSSGLFPRSLGWLGAIAGTLVVAGGVVGTAGAGDTGTSTTSAIRSRERPSPSRGSG